MKPNIIDKCTDRILGLIKNNATIDDKQTVILTYGLGLVINNIIAFAIALIPALLLGNLYHVAIILLTVSALRSFSGGAHNSNIINCAVNGAVISNLLGLLMRFLILNRAALYSFIIATFFFSLWAIGKYAPADTPSKPIVTVVKKHLLKRNSYIVLAAWCFICIYWFLRIPQVSTFIYASTLGILWQSFTLTRAGYKLYDGIDKGLNKLRRVE